MVLTIRCYCNRNNEWTNLFNVAQNHRVSKNGKNLKTKQVSDK